MNYSDNDDDLFDYDPNSSTAESVSFKEESKFTSKELINNFKVAIENDSDITNTGNLDSDKIRISNAYYGAYNRFITEIKRDSLAKSLVITLNSLTNNDFSLISMFYDLEMKISRRMLFIDLSNLTFTSKLEVDSEVKKVYEGFIENVEKIFNIKFNEFYIETFYLSTVSISKHALNLDRAMYLSLSKKLQIPVKQVLFDDRNDMSESDHDVYLDSFKRTIDEMIHQELINNGLMDEIKTLFGKDVDVSF